MAVYLGSTSAKRLTASQQQTEKKADRSRVSNRFQWAILYIFSGTFHTLIKLFTSVPGDASGRFLGSGDLLHQFLLSFLQINNG